MILQWTVKTSDKMLAEYVKNVKMFEYVKNVKNVYNK